MKQSPLADLSPDGYSRFYFMVILLKILYEEKPKSIVKTLDVGGASPYMSEAFSSLGFNGNLSVIDSLPCPEGLSIPYTQADATNMPFEDKSFDTVISTDVLEHIKPDKKLKFIDECLRVAKDYVIMAAPFDTVGVDQSEKIVNKLNRQLFGHDQEWLKEHFLYQKPKVSDVERHLKELDYSWEILSTSNLYVWLVSTCANLIEAKVGIDIEKHKELNRNYGRNILLSGELDQPSYRQFIIIYKSNNHRSLKDVAQSTLNENSDRQASIGYIGGLMGMYSDKLLSQSQEIDLLNEEVSNLNSSRIKEQNSELRAELSDCRKKLAEQERTIELCLPYLRFRSSVPGIMIRKSRRLLKKNTSLGYSGESGSKKDKAK